MTSRTDIFSRKILNCDTLSNVKRFLHKRWRNRITSQKLFGQEDSVSFFSRHMEVINNLQLFNSSHWFLLRPEIRALITLWRQLSIIFTWEYKEACLLVIFSTNKSVKLCSYGSIIHLSGNKVLPKSFPSQSTGGYNLDAALSQR